MGGRGQDGWNWWGHGGGGAMERAGLWASGSSLSCMALLLCVPPGSPAYQASLLPRAFGEEEVHVPVQCPEQALSLESERS